MTGKASSRRRKPNWVGDSISLPLQGQKIQGKAYRCLCGYFLSLYFSPGRMVQGICNWPRGTRDLFYWLTSLQTAAPLQVHVVAASARGAWVPFAQTRGRPGGRGWEEGSLEGMGDGGMQDDSHPKIHFLDHLLRVTLQNHAIK